MEREVGKHSRKVKIREIQRSEESAGLWKSLSPIHKVRKWKAWKETSRIPFPLIITFKVIAARAMRPEWEKHTNKVNRNW